MRRRLFRSFLFVLSALSLVGTLVPVTQAAPVVDLQLVVGRTDVAQGVPFRFRAVATNPSAESKTLVVTFSVYPAGAPASAVPFERWQELLPANDVLERRGRVTTSQYFAGRGTFVLEARTSDGAIRRRRFEVKRSAIRVPRFRDVTGSRGAETTLLGNDQCGEWSAGAAWADIEGDGDLDLFVPRKNHYAHMWVNESGTFVDEALPRGVRGTGGTALGAVFADYDNDSDPDLYVVADGPNYLYENDGAGNFVDRAPAAGVIDEAPSQSASWADYDSDGFLDLFVADHGRCPAGAQYFQDRLYHNEGDGTFTDATHLLDAQGSTMGAGFQGAWFDYDRDRDVDLYLANDFWGSTPEHNFLWRNDEGSFSDVSVASGTALSINSMGLAIGDYDRDLDFDIGISNIYSSALLRNEGDGTFREVAKRARVDRPLQTAEIRSVTWGLTFADFNNDGWEDLYVPAGPLGVSGHQPNGMFTNGRSGKFLDHSAPSRTDHPGVGRGVALADFDRDGRMDLYLLNQNGSPVLYRNTTSRRNAHWLEVDLQGTVSNRDACGAIVTVRPVDSRKSMVRQLLCGGTSLGTGADQVLHFGLGNRDAVARLAIEWPSGSTTVRSVSRVDRLITIVEKG